ncbi:hypothetical protein EMCRGX_G029015 [Ephydatia muelleri]
MCNLKARQQFDDERIPSMTCIMDQVYHRQPVWSGGGSSAAAIGPVPMEMLEYYPPPFSSPPATPITPITPATPHPNMFTAPHIYTDHPSIYTAPVPSHHPPHLLPVFEPAALEYRLYAMCQHLRHCVEHLLVVELYWMVYPDLWVTTVGCLRL